MEGREEGEGGAPPSLAWPSPPPPPSPWLRQPACGAALAMVGEGVGFRGDEEWAR